MDKNDSFSEYNKNPLGRNRTNNPFTLNPLQS